MKDLPLYLGFRVLSGIIGALPEPVMRNLGRGLGHVWYYVAPGRRRIAARNLQRVIGDDATPEAVREMFALGTVFQTRIAIRREVLARPVRTSARPASLVDIEALILGPVARIPA